jgi:nicotinamidase/pyrazinamidase
VVDLQNDLIPPGAVAVPMGDTIVPLINQLTTRFELVVAAQNWHPINHVKFFTQHPGTRPLQSVQVDGHAQLLWPDHCIQNTRGADLALGLNLTRLARVFQKGTYPRIDSFSAFYDADRMRSTGMAEFLKAKGVSDVYIAGLATNFGVKNTAIDAVRLGFKPLVIVDATRGYNFRPDDVINAVKEMEDARVQIVMSESLLQEASPP